MDEVVSLRQSGMDVLEAGEEETQRGRTVSGVK